MAGSVVHTWLAVQCTQGLRSSAQMFRLVCFLNSNNTYNTHTHTHTLRQHINLLTGQHKIASSHAGCGRAPIAGLQFHTTPPKTKRRLKEWGSQWWIDGAHISIIHPIAGSTHHRYKTKTLPLEARGNGKPPWYNSG